MDNGGDAAPAPEAHSAAQGAWPASTGGGGGSGSWGSDVAAAQAPAPRGEGQYAPAVRSGSGLSSGGGGSHDPAADSNGAAQGDWQAAGGGGGGSGSWGPALPANQAPAPGAAVRHAPFALPEAAAPLSGWEDYEPAAGINGASKGDWLAASGGGAGDWGAANGAPPPARQTHAPRAEQRRPPAARAGSGAPPGGLGDPAPAAEPGGAAGGAWQAAGGGCGRAGGRSAGAAPGRAFRAGVYDEAAAIVHAQERGRPGRGGDQGDWKENLLPGAPANAQSGWEGQAPGQAPGGKRPAPYNPVRLAPAPGGAPAAGKQAAADDGLSKMSLLFPHLFAQEAGRR